MRKLFYYLLSLFSPLVKQFYRKNLRVLVYHEVPDSKIFQSHLNYLKSNYSLIDIPTLEKHLNKGTALPKFPLLITFDDAYYNIFENAIPHLVDRRIPACIFVVTSYVDSDKQFWWIQAVEEYKEKGLSSKIAQQKKWRLKNMENKERLAVLKKMEEKHTQQISSRMLKELDSENIRFGNHTHTHPMLNQCTEKEVFNEIRSSQRKFDTWGISGKGILAYPNGNWNKEVEALIKTNNVEMAFLFDHKINAVNINKYRISRISTNATLPVPELKVKVSGLHSLIFHVIDTKN